MIQHQYLGTYAGCTDDGIKTVSLLCYSDFQFWEQLLQFRLILARVTDCVKVYLEVVAGEKSDRE